MKRLVLAAAALAGITGFAGAASAAPTEASGVEAKAVHTLRWKGVEIASHNVGGHDFAGADRLRSVKTGEIVGTTRSPAGTSLARTLHALTWRRRSRVGSWLVVSSASSRPTPLYSGDPC